MNPSIPVIGSTAVGIRSKTIEIKNKNLFGTYLKLLNTFFGLFGTYCNLLLNIYLILASVENLLEFRNLFGRLYELGHFVESIYYHQFASKLYKNINNFILWYTTPICKFLANSTVRFHWGCVDVSWNLM